MNCYSIHRPVGITTVYSDNSVKRNSNEGRYALKVTHDVIILTYLWCVVYEELTT